MAEPIIHVLGTLVLDTVIRIDALPGHDEKAFARAVDYVPGGPTSFVASAIAQFGAPVRLHTSLGHDDAAAKILAALSARGVDMSQVRLVAGQATPSCIIMVDDTGEKAIIILPSDPALLEGHGKDAVFDDGATLVTHLFHPAAMARAIGAVGAAGGTALVDLEWPEFERWGEAAALQALSQADVVVTNAQFLARYRGDATIEAARLLAADLAIGRRAACVTLGKEGLVLAAYGRQFHLSAVPVVPKNTTGAGDTFIGSLAVALARGLDPIFALGFANQAAGHFLAGQGLDFDTLATAAAAAPPKDLA